MLSPTLRTTRISSGKATHEKFARNHPSDCEERCVALVTDVSRNNRTAEELHLPRRGDVGSGELGNRIMRFLINRNAERGRERGRRGVEVPQLAQFGDHGGRGKALRQRRRRYGRLARAAGKPAAPVTPVRARGDIAGTSEIAVAA
ncbi:hypothetical protein SAMD00023353_3200590 [Rosellinia necatrix]|uniref:Uncharacterized protein n=1 Tax=Rosellinia necatrix TaxID=77044 RepID=A0A1S8A8L1_ROSNE|nr:hypothetical protein SAMD00023353_3200590 [Rosellinia necatrix]